MERAREILEGTAAGDIRLATTRASVEEGALSWSCDDEAAYLPDTGHSADDGAEDEGTDKYWSAR